MKKLRVSEIKKITTGTHLEGLNEVGVLVPAGAVTEFTGNVFTTTKGIFSVERVDLETWNELLQSTEPPSE